jgi:hypothetical protein
MGGGHDMETPWDEAEGRGRNPQEAGYVLHSINISTHCNGNSVYIFLFRELRGLSPDFLIHVSVSDLYIPRIHIFPPAEKADPSWEYIIRSQTHECGNWG